VTGSGGGAGAQALAEGRPVEAGAEHDKQSAVVCQLLACCLRGTSEVLTDPHLMKDVRPRVGPEADETFGPEHVRRQRLDPGREPTLVQRMVDVE
jgi:hypothetical protein